MLKLKELRIANIGRFVGEHSVRLDNKPLLLQVDAQNHNTGGSSGSGKSTLFNSLEFLLNTNHVPATILQSRLTKNAISVSGVFDMEGSEIVVTRSKGSGLSISVDGLDVSSGNNKMAEEKLDEILGIPRDLLRKMIHKRQKEGGFFLNLSPKESHAFLADTLNLKFWTEKQAYADQESKQLAQKVESLKIAIDSLEQSIFVSRQSVSSLEEPSIDFDQEILDNLEKQAYQASSALESKQKDLESALQGISRPIASAPVSRDSLSPLRIRVQELKAQQDFERKKHMEELSAVSASIQDKQSKAASLKHSISKLPHLNLELEELKKKIITLHSKTCPTCEQKWHDGSEIELGRLVEMAKTKKNLIEEIESSKTALTDLEVEIKNLELTLQNVKAKIGTSPLAKDIHKAEEELGLEALRLDRIDQQVNLAYIQDTENARKKEQELRLSFQDEIAALSYNRDMSQSLFVQKKQELASYLSSKEMFEKNKKALLEALGSQSAQLDSLKQEQSKAIMKSEVALEASKVLKGYINSMFQDTLDSIAEKATTILSRIPNMQTASIYFEGFKETKAGSVKEEITAIVTMDSEIGIPIKSMSGGERTAIDLAVDLAVIDMVEERAGKGLDLFILDEPFDGLDAACREQCLEILKTHISDKRIVIVDHSNETKEMVEGRILVIRDGQESRIDDTVL